MDKPTLPKMMYAADALDTLADGCELLAQMVRNELYEHKGMPPAPVFSWYVRNTVFRFVAEEYRSIYDPAPDSLETVSQMATEVDVLLDLMAQTKQLGLQAQVQNILSTRVLHLPEGYIVQLNRDKLPL